MAAITPAAATRPPSARDHSQTLFRNNYNSASTKELPSEQSSLSLKSDSIETSQNLLQGNEADTETTSISRNHRKRRNSTTVPSPKSVIRQQISPLKSTARQTTQRPSTSDSLYSPDSNYSPVDRSPSYFTLRPSNSNDLRSPTIKRPPASRSSHGVETSSGPPPAISTQRAFSFDLQPSPSASQFTEHSKLTPKALAELNASGRGNQGEGQSYSSEFDQPSRGRSTKPRSVESQTAKTIDISINTAPEFRMDRRSKRFSVDGGRIAAHGLSTHLNDTNLALQDAVSSGSSHEDLFLNMAQVAGGDDVDQERQSRTVFASHRPSISKAKPTDRATTTHERRSSLRRPEIISDYRTPQSERITSREREYPSTAHPLEGNYSSRPSNTSPTARRTDAYADSPSIRKSEIPSAYHNRFRSTQLPTTTNAFYSSPITPRHQSLDHEPSLQPQRTTEGTESSVSTTAPSTVWDELEDLKSRIRKLEVTGKLPPSSSGSMERPRTAATSNTTMSSSPKRNGMKSASPTTNGFDEVSPHPLLNSALIKAKASISLRAYRALEASAADAMNLAKMTFASNNPTAFERQLKRKADNMCRSLTELCIALSASNPAQPERPPTRTRSVSRDARALRNFHSPEEQPTPDAIEDRRFERAQSLDPEPTNSQRVLSRLEARRTSMKIDAINAANAQASPQTELHMELKTPTQSTVSRTNTVLQRRRLAEGYNADDQDNTIRPLSRATTDLARANTTSAIDRERKRMSREYTSNHPLPSPLPRNFPGVSNIPGTRRSYLTGVGSNVGSTTTTGAQTNREKDLPATPTTPGFGSRRYLTRTSNIGGQEEIATGRTVEPRQRLVSTGQYTAARSLISARAGDRRSYHEATTSDDAMNGGQF